MQTQLQTLKRISARIHARLSDTLAVALLTPVVSLLCSPAMAALPTMPTPEGIGGGTIAEGDWLGAMGGWFKTGLTILGLVLVGLGFMYAVMGALQKWKAYSAGRAEIGDLKEYFVMAAVFAVFLVVMATYSAKVFL